MSVNDDYDEESAADTKFLTNIADKLKNLSSLQKLPSETNVLPTIRIVFPAIRPRSCTIVTWIRPFPMTRDSRRFPKPHRLRSSLLGVHQHNIPCHPRFRSRTLSRTGRTYRVPDTDPSDEAEDILTQPVPHFTRRID
ncbi:hypothetical protein B0H14DRAFT_3496857 [Mycena olivaceomarginata]|nr:hypothetical protein B0H14DRAFT_3496857 [Mycena olivaceomarginata]